MKNYTLLYIGLVLMCVSACTSSGNKDDVLVVSIAPQQWLLEQLAPQGTRIETILTGGADPETFEPTMQQRMDVAGARIYFGTGALPFESRLSEASDRYVNTSEGMEYIYGTHIHHHHGAESNHSDHGDADPHIWTSVSGARNMARNMAEALSEAYPDSSLIISQKLQKLIARLDSTDASIRQRLAEAPTRSFAIWHPSLSYYARDYGLEQIAVGLESKEMSVRQVHHVIEEAREEGVRIFFFQREYDSRQAEGINTEIGSRLVTISPLDYDWEAQINLITDALARP